MLKNDFYQVLDQTGARSQEGSSGRFTITVGLNEPHRIYEGHFPGNPVVPGVCQVALIRELVSGILGKNLRLETADNIKFLSMIQPGVQKRLKVDLEIKDAAEGKQEVQALISADEKIFMKFKGQFKPGG